MGYQPPAQQQRNVTGVTSRPPLPIAMQQQLDEAISAAQKYGLDEDFASLLEVCLSALGAEKGVPKLAVCM